METRTYTCSCENCGNDFSYERRIQTRGRFRGKWMGRARGYCSEVCRTKATNTRLSTGGKKERRTIINRCCRKLGGVQGENLTELQLLTKMEELLDYVIQDEPLDEVTVQTHYIDAVNDLLELGLINSDQQIKMLKIAEKWN